MDSEEAVVSEVEAAVVADLVDSAVADSAEVVQVAAGNYIQLKKVMKYMNRILFSILFLFKADKLLTLNSI